MLYQWIIFLHVASVLLFFMAHGATVAVSLRLRRERSAERLRPLLDLSDGWRMASNVALLLILVTGIIGGFLGNWWGSGWIWLSLGLLVVISAAMGAGMSSYFGQLRKAVGSPYRVGMRLVPAEASAAETEIATLVGSTVRVTAMTVASLVLTVGIVYLMIFRPF